MLRRRCIAAATGLVAANFCGSVCAEPVRTTRPSGQQIRPRHRAASTARDERWRCVAGRRTDRSARYVRSGAGSNRRLLALNRSSRKPACPPERASRRLGSGAAAGGSLPWRGISAGFRGPPSPSAAARVSPTLRLRRDRPAPPPQTPTTTSPASLLSFLRRQTRLPAARSGGMAVSAGPPWRCPRGWTARRGLAWCQCLDQRPRLHWDPRGLPTPFPAGRPLLRRPDPALRRSSHVGSWCSGRSLPGAVPGPPSAFRSRSPRPCPLVSSRGALRALRVRSGCARRAHTRVRARAARGLSAAAAGAAGTARVRVCAPAANQLDEARPQLGPAGTVAGRRRDGRRNARLPAARQHPLDHGRLSPHARLVGAEAKGLASSLGARTLSITRPDLVRRCIIVLHGASICKRRPEIVRTQYDRTFTGPSSLPDPGASRSARKLATSTGTCACTAAVFILNLLFLQDARMCSPSFRGRAPCRLRWQARAVMWLPSLRAGRRR